MSLHVLDGHVVAI
jgi:hypothetical protein